jgi:hypothetical protein
MLQVELAPEIEKRLVAAARAEGLEPAAYASRLISATINARINARINAPIDVLTSEKHLSQEELDAVLDRLASRGDNMPDLPDEAYTRESFYQDHD